MTPTQELYEKLKRDDEHRCIWSPMISANDAGPDYDYDTCTICHKVALSKHINYRPDLLYPNLTDPDDEAFCWMVERATEKGLHIQIVAGSVSAYKCYIGPGMQSYESYGESLPHVLRDTLVGYYGIGKEIETNGDE